MIHEFSSDVPPAPPSSFDPPPVPSPLEQARLEADNDAAVRFSVFCLLTWLSHTTPDEVARATIDLADFVLEAKGNDRERRLGLVQVVCKRWQTIQPTAVCALVRAISTSAIEAVP